MFNLPTKQEDLQSLMDNAPTGWTGLSVSDDGGISYFINANNVVLLKYATFLDCGVWIDVSNNHPVYLIDENYLKYKMEQNAG